MNFIARTFYLSKLSLSALFIPEMKMAILANLLGAISKLSHDLGFLIRVKMLSLWIMFRESLAVMSYPVY